MFIDLLRLMRPRHWLKNCFIFLPVPFALAEGLIRIQGEAIFTLVTGWLSFGFLASSIYAFNDVRDRERDSIHPLKGSRPVASGRLSSRSAIFFGVGLLLLSFSMQMGSGLERMSPYSLTYFLLNLFYISRGREIPFVDIGCISGGFLLRILIGCALIDVPPSPWLLACGTSVAIFLALGKRRGDLIEGVDEKHRMSLKGYSLRGLDHGMLASAMVSFISYSIYSFYASPFLEGREWISLPFVFYGLAAHLLRVMRGVERRSPVDALTGSWDLMLVIIGWVFAVWFALGGWSS